MKNFIKNNPLYCILFFTFIAICIGFSIQIAKLPDRNKIKNGTVTIFDKRGATQMQYKGRIEIIGNDIHVYLNFEEDYK